MPDPALEPSGKAAEIEVAERGGHLRIYNDVW